MTSIDGAVMWPNGKVYFFSGPKYYRYDIAAEKVDDNYPLPIQEHWPGLRLGNAYGQGAVAWPDGKAYFFSGDQYYQYDIATDRVDPGFPAPTRLKWRGVLAGPFNDYRIDAALIWPNRKVYMFQHDLYYAWDVANGKMDPGYPLITQDKWPGLWITGQGFTGAFVWPKPIDGKLKAYFFQRGLYMRYDIAGNRADPGYPQPIQGNWRGL